jgi:hypothetical protein
MRTLSRLATSISFLRETILRYHLTAAFLLLLPAIAAAQGTEIIRGRITGSDGKPIADVGVTITGLSTQEVKTAKSNDKGIFTALFTNAEGDYLVNVRKIGYSPYNTRVTRTGLSTVLVADITLREIAFELDTITVLGRRATPKDDEASIGGFEKNLLAGALFSLDPGDLIALAGQIPGILALGDTGYSVLGAGSNANGSTIDGAKFGGNNVPQDALGTSRMIQTSADPRVGNFSGGQIASTLRGGTDIFAMTARANFQDQHLAWADPDWPSPIARIAGTSGTVGGPIIKKRLHYQASWTVRDNVADVYSLVDPPPAVLSQYGLTLDTVNAVSHALNQLGVPLIAQNYSTSRQGRNYNTSEVIDWTPKATTSLRLSHTGSWGTNGSPGQAPFAYPSLGSQSDNQFHFLSARLTGYVHGFLDELSSTVNYSQFSSDPFLHVPSASVRVGTVFDDGHTGLSTMQFGGGSGVNRSRGTDWDTQNEFSWIPANSKHRVKIGQEFDYSWSTNYSSGNQYGSYAYQTLADLAANKPASYNLTLSSFERSSKGATMALWVGDEWSASKALNFQGGLRLDAAFPGTLPSYNPVVDQLFGVKTNQVPHTSFVTPRLGFSWASAERRGMGSPTGQGGPISIGALGNLPPEFVMAMLGTPRGSVAPGWAVNGSFGAYGSPLDNGSVASLIDQTGLPNTRRALTCVGDATPIPNWSAINNAAPTSCLDGAGATTFSSNVPSVQVYDVHFHMPISWRANLGIDGIRLPAKWTLGLTSFYNLGVNGGSAQDFNLNPTPYFTLPNEGNRQVYVPASAIVPSTGVIAPNAYRINPNYGAVRDVISDLHNYTLQWQASIAPPRPLLHNHLFNVSLTYVYNYGRRQQRGLGGGGGGGNFFTIVRDGVSFSGFGSGGGGGGFAIDGDPNKVAWVPASQPTHQINAVASFRAWWFNITTRLNVYSGTPFTPSVAGDVNGDGMNNDLAFIPNPATTADPALAAQMTQLLAAAPAGARDCLLTQLGQIAGINSCTTQWQARLDVRIDWQPPRSFGFGDRLRLTTVMQNTSGALVRLFGLENTPLGRGALGTDANGQLLYVTGFDPATNNYKYQVNQLFGQPRNFGNARRQYPPFQLQLGLQYQLGGPQRAPMAHSMGFVPGDKEPPYTADQIRDKLQRLSKDPVQPILVRKDSIALTPDQVTQLGAISKQFRAQSDSALEPVFDYIMKKGRKIDDQELGSRLSRSTPQIQRMLQAANTRARALLTPAQLRMVPGPPPTPGTMPGGAKPPAASGANGNGGADVIVMPGGVVKVGGGGLD